MNFAEFIGGSGRGASTQADAERAVNWYVENVESPTGRAKGGRMLRSKPGLYLFCALPNATSVAALCAANGRVFAVAGGTLYELAANGTYYPRGAVGESTTPQNTTLCASETQLLILASGNGFIFDLTANTLTQIVSDGWIPGALAVAFIDAYFLVLEPNSQSFAISAPNDGTSWNALDFGSAEGEQGNIVGMLADHRQLWLLGNTHSEVYYDSGDANFPFTRLEGAFLEQGISAPRSAVNIDNTIMWLGGNRDGAGVVWRADGYTPQRVSTHAVETAIQRYAASADAIGYAYQEEGHTFYHLSFPSANAGRGWTWTYDIASGLWHERGYWQAAPGEWCDDLARVHAYGFGAHLAGDWQSGNVYVQTMQYALDNGAPIRRERIAPALTNQLGRYAYHDELRLACETGIGLPGATPGTRPTPAYVQSVSAGFAESGTPQSNSITLAGPATPGNAILAVVVYDNVAGGVFESLTDSHANEYLPLFSAAIAGGGSGGNDQALVFLARAIAGGSTTLTAAFTGGGGAGVALAAHEYSGLGYPSGMVSAAWPSTSGAGLQLPALAAPADALVFLLIADAWDGGGQAFSSAPAVTPREYSYYDYQRGIVVRSAGLHSADALFPNAATEAYAVGNNGSALNAAAVVAAFAFPYAGSGVPAPPPIAGAAYQDPQMSLSVSDDGGKTYAPTARQRSMGQVGAYRTLLRWLQLGRSNNRVYRATCTEPCQVAIVGAELDATPEAR